MIYEYDPVTQSARVGISGHDLDLMDNLAAAEAGTVKVHPCGLKPIEFNVLIDPDPVEEKTAGGLWKPEERQEKDKFATSRGTIVAVSPLAFNYADWPDEADKPKPGDRVAFQQFGGTFIDGQDGKKYRICKDKDILAVLS